MCRNEVLGDLHSRRFVGVGASARVSPVSLGCHLSGRERILSGAISLDGRAAILEALFIQVTLEACGRGLPPEQAVHPTGETPGRGNNQTFSLWQQLDGMELDAVFNARFRVMQSCPHHLRGKVPSRSQSGTRGKARRSEDGRSDHGSPFLESFLSTAIVNTIPPIQQNIREKWLREEWL